MKKSFAALLAAGTLLVFVGCAYGSGVGEDGFGWIIGSGIVTTENRVVSPFSGIVVEGSGDVEYGGGGRATIASSGSGTARQR